MDKRFQVFISSTFQDLQSERKQAVRAILDCDCFPAGMELFPATDERQWDYITKVIDDSDFYLLIIASRYGSVDNDGISFTEKEYLYAKDKGIPIIAILHKNPKSLHDDQTTELDKRLVKFIDDVKTGRLVAWFENPVEVAYEVQKSLNYLKRNSSAIGWIRTDEALDPKVMVKYSEIQNENRELRMKLDKQKYSVEKPKDYDSYESGSSKVSLIFRVVPSHGTETRSVEIERTWDHLFSLTGMLFQKSASTTEIVQLLRNECLKEASIEFNIPNTTLIEIDKICCNKIIFQFVSLGYIRKEEKYEDKWVITAFGLQYLSGLLAIKK